MTASLQRMATAPWSRSCVDTNEKVDKLYKKAMSLGAIDEGAAGPRGDTFYAGYFRDPDGNKLNCFCMKM